MMKINWTTILLPILAVNLLIAHALAPRVIDEHEIRRIDISTWPGRSDRDGTADSQAARERNIAKNRRMPREIQKTYAWSFQEFIGKTAQISSKIGLTPSGRAVLDEKKKDQLKKAEGHVVSVTGYLVVAYAGPKESVNSDSAYFHDWHLEICNKPMDHPPARNDPTAIVCEITPHTERKLYDDGVRLQNLAAFTRSGERPNLVYRRTASMRAHRVRITGYLLWDDSHVQPGQDVGATIEQANRGDYHHPWRQSAWEVHPVFKIERLD